MPDRPLPGWPRAMRAPIAAAYCGISESTMRALPGFPPPVHLSGRIPVWYREDLDAWLDARRRDAGLTPANPLDHALGL